MDTSSIAFTNKADLVSHKISKKSPPIISLKRKLGSVQDKIRPSTTPSTDAHQAKCSNNSTNNLRAVAPLAERLRPQVLTDFVGQDHLIGPESPLLHLLQGPWGSSGNLILWGPSGSGKTTLARLLARRTNAIMKELSATSSGMNDVRVVFEEAKSLLKLTGRRTILFLDEVHRFNRMQQDIFLPYLEQGHIQLIGATTENPSFKINSTLLSRSRVFVLEKLTEDNIIEILNRAISRILHEGSPSPDLLSSPQVSLQFPTTLISPQNPFPQLTSKVKATIVTLAVGDARTAISLLELVLSSPSTIPESVLIANLRHSVSTRYDRAGDSRYDMISALHKSVRGSDGSAALYWLARMLTAGEDPLYIARRLIVIASEDIGLASDNALSIATATLLACQDVGMPECRINLAHCVAHLAESPKSTRAYEAYTRAEAAALMDATVPVPILLRNAPTRLLKELDCGKDYAYNPAYAHPVHQEYLPPHLRGERFLKAESDATGKIWDEGLLRKWELECNGGRAWNSEG